jgi:hypothetical protein
MSTDQHAKSVVKGIIKDLKSLYGNGWTLLTHRQRETEVWARILGVVMSQDEALAWDSVRQYAQRIIDASGELLEGEA